jgi:hypothetical protein
VARIGHGQKVAQLTQVHIKNVSNWPCQDI